MPRLFNRTKLGDLDEFQLPILAPVQDLQLVLRIAEDEYLAVADKDAPPFGTIGEIEHALDAGVIRLHDKIKARFETIDENGNVVRQVQTAADLAKNGASRLAGVEFPGYEDNETTIDQLKERLAKTAAYLKTVDTKKIDGSGDREITFPLGPTNRGHMNGADYLNHFVLPNFYFHLTTAYAILRHCGVDIGKQDFLGKIPIKVT